MTEEIREHFVLENLTSRKCDACAYMPRETPDAVAILKVAGYLHYLCEECWNELEFDAHNRALIIRDQADTREANIRKHVVVIPAGDGENYETRLTFDGDVYPPASNRIEELGLQFRYNCIKCEYRRLPDGDWTTRRPAWSPSDDESRSAPMTGAVRS